MKLQAVLERRKRGGLKSKLSSEQISCTHQKNGGLVENQINFWRLPDQGISRNLETIFWPFVKNREPVKSRLR